MITATSGCQVALETAESEKQESLIFYLSSQTQTSHSRPHKLLADSNLCLEMFFPLFPIPFLDSLRGVSILLEKKVDTTGWEPNRDQMVCNSFHTLS